MAEAASLAGLGAARAARELHLSSLRGPRGRPVLPRLRRCALPDLPFVWRRAARSGGVLLELRERPQGGHRGGFRTPAGRRVIRVLFGDLVGSTTIGERLNPEDLRTLQADLYALLNAEVEHSAA